MWHNIDIKAPTFYSNSKIIPNILYLLFFPILALFQIFFIYYSIQSSHYWSNSFSYYSFQSSHYWSNSFSYYSIFFAEISQKLFINKFIPSAIFINSLCKMRENIKSRRFTLTIISNIEKFGGGDQ